MTTVLSAPRRTAHSAFLLATFGGLTAACMLGGSPRGGLGSPGEAGAAATSPPVAGIVQAFIREDLRLTELSVAIDADEVDAQSLALPGVVSFDDALRLAMKSFLEDARDLESPLRLTEELSREAIAPPTLREFLDRPDSVLALVPLAPRPRPGKGDGAMNPWPANVGGHRVWSAEAGETVQANWIFYLSIPAPSDHLHWAVVDRIGAKAPYNYGFN